MTALGRALLVTVAMLGPCLSSGTAHADAVPPPPKRCPKGQVGITSHSGPECVLDAPKNCKPGYRGELRGRCVLARCSSDDQCEGGRRCLQIEVCQEYRELHWTGWGWSAQTPVLRDNFLGGPPRPQPPGPNKKDWVLLSICGQDGACQAPAECRPAGLCYPPSAVGKTKAKVVSSATPETPPVSSSDAQAPEAPDASGAGGTAGVSNPDVAGEGAAGGPATSPPTIPNPEPPVSDNGGGCRKGCSATSTPSAMGWVGIPLLLGAWLSRRRRRAAARNGDFRPGATVDSPSGSVAE